MGRRRRINQAHNHSSISRTTHRRPWTLRSEYRLQSPIGWSSFVPRFLRSPLAHTTILPNRFSIASIVSSVLDLARARRIPLTEGDD